MPRDRDIEIAELRWPCIIYLRAQDRDPDGAGMIDTLTNPVPVHAGIEAMGPITFYSGVAVDSPVTHRITIRWLDWLDTRYVIVRTTIRRDGTTRVETYRIRRILDIAGRQRFALIEAELETRANG